jgi:hypothetical protein
LNPQFLEDPSGTYDLINVEQIKKQTRRDQKETPPYSIPDRPISHPIR